MDGKQKDIIERNRSLLVGNIILTDEFYQLLRTESVLPETMIRDIQVRKTQEERNNKLLETLKLRGCDAYRRFRHVLYLSGHLFLADHLYGEDIDAKILRAEDIFGKYPNVFNHVSDDAKSKLLRHLETKVREKALINDWVKSGPERSELLEAKKIGFENEKDFRIRLEVKSKKIIHLKNELIQLTEEINKRDAEIFEMQKDINDMKRNFKEELNKQTRFNAANSSSIMQLRCRFDSMNERVRVINVYIRGFLEPDELNDIEEDPDNVKMSMLERNVKKLIQITRTNLENTSTSVNEKEVVLSMLKVSSRQKEQTVSDVVRKYMEKQEKGTVALSKELDDLLSMARGQKFTAKMKIRPIIDMKLLKSQVALLREEVEHIKKKLEWKDSKISDLIQENNNLRDQQQQLSEQQSMQHQTITLPRIQAAPHFARDSPDSNREIEQVYQQFDRYMHESFPSSPTSNQEPRKRRGSLADVSLERDISSSPEFKNRRSSKADSVEIDILGTSTANRRSSSDLRSESLKNMSVVNENGKTKHTLSPRSMPSSLMNKSKTDTSDKMKDEHRKRKEHRAEPIASFLREGRRPSLADLITIYENSKEEIDEETHNMLPGLPVLQEI